MIAPKSGQFRGIIEKKPWEYEVTVVIPHIETPELLELCIGLYKLSDPEPYIIVVDTGSTKTTCRKIEKFRTDNVEIHFIRGHSYKHPSEPVALAMDLAMLNCHTRWLFCTHADCFLRKRDAIREMINISLKRDNPCVGYQLSPRPHWEIDGKPCDDWKWMVGHTFTLFDNKALDEYNLIWSLRRGALKKNWSINEATNPAKIPNVTDTETFINYQLVEIVGKKPFLIGVEENYVRNVNEHFDHIRSAPSAKIYLPKNDPLRAKQENWIEMALKEAQERVDDWSK